MTPIYSIIIPVYNAEKYLESSIESVIGQSSGSAYEIILVNDGSRDGSAGICDRYAEQDARIRVIHQKNQGVSAARNAGIAVARGQYVLFLDSDDLWNEKLLESVDCIVPQQPDMIRFGYCVFSENGIKQTVLPACVAGGEPGEAHFQQHEKMGVMPIVACWAAAFRRSFLLEHRLSFPLGVSYGEDVFFVLHSLKQAQSVYTISRPLYQYRVNEMSLTHTLAPKKIKEMLSVCAKLYRLFPGSLLADYYCMSIWDIEKLKREDAGKLNELLQENRDILQHISGRKPRVARVFYRIFGWYQGAKLLRVLTDFRNSVKG